MDSYNYSIKNDYRGRGAVVDKENPCTVTLPRYVDRFATDFTVTLTSIGKKPVTLSATEIINGSFEVYGEPCSFHWLVYGKRYDIDVEPYKTGVNVQGQGPYRWIQP